MTLTGQSHQRSRNTQVSDTDVERERFIARRLEDLFKDRDVLEYVGKQENADRPDVGFWKRVLHVVQFKQPEAPLFPWHVAIRILRIAGKRTPLDEINAPEVKALLSAFNPAGIELFDTCSSDATDAQLGKQFLVARVQNDNMLLYVRRDEARRHTMEVMHLEPDRHGSLYPVGLVLQSILLAWMRGEKAASETARTALCEIVPPRIRNMKRPLGALYDECAFVVQHDTVLDVHRPDCVVTFSERGATHVHQPRIRVHASKHLRKGEPILSDYSLQVLLRGSERPPGGSSGPILSRVMELLFTDKTVDQMLVRTSDGLLVLFTHERHVMHPLQR